MTVATATGQAGLDVRRHLTELRERRARDRLDEDVEDPAAGQADRYRVVVAHAIALQHGPPGRDHLLAQLIDRTLDASTRDRADRLAVASDEHRCTSGPWRRAPGRDDGAHRDCFAVLPPLQEPVQYLTHEPHPCSRTC